MAKQTQYEFLDIGGLSILKEEFDKVVSTSNQDLKKYADNLNQEMDSRVDSLEDKSHIHENSDILKNITSGKVNNWNDAYNQISAVFDTYTGSTELSDVLMEIDNNATSEAKKYVDTKINTLPNTYYTETEIDTKVSELTEQINEKSDTGHTHKYAGSSSEGGSANSAVKLDSSAGSELQPIYFKDGKPVATAYTLNKSVPTDAKFTDTIYTHPTYPAKTGVPTANQNPKHGESFTVTQPVSDESGHIIAMNSRTITLPSETQLSKTNSGNGNAITDIEVNGHNISITKGKTFSESGHKHTKSEIADFPTSMKNPSALKVGEKTYDGSSEITITASDLGLASAMKFLGTSTTAITDGSKTKTITVSGSSVTVTSGNVVLYGSKEFVWNGSSWEELGNEGSYKVVQEAVNSPSASGNATAFIDTISQDTNGKITVTKKNVSFPSLSGGTASTNDATVTGGVTVNGHAVTVAKKTLVAGDNVIITGGTDNITISADNVYSKSEVYSKEESDAKYLTEHPVIPLQSTGGTEKTLDYGSKQMVVVSVSRDENGHMTNFSQSLLTLPSVDTAFSETSTNPIQNKVVTETLNAKADIVDTQSLYNKTTTWNEDETVFTTIWSKDGITYKEVYTEVSETQYTKQYYINDVLSGTWTTVVDETNKVSNTTYTA